MSFIGRFRENREKARRDIEAVVYPWISDVWFLWWYEKGYIDQDRLRSLYRRGLIDVPPEAAINDLDEYWVGE